MLSFAFAWAVSFGVTWALVKSSGLFLGPMLGDRHGSNVGRDVDQLQMTLVGEAGRAEVHGKRPQHTAL